MPKLKVLIVEDRATDAQLMQLELKKAQMDFESIVVEEKDQYEKALREFIPDVILSDYNLPRFGALEAIKILRKTSPGTPLVVVTGSVSEEAAVECMMVGAWDYVIKEHMIRLAPSVQQALMRRDAEKRRDTALRRIERLNSVLLSFGPDNDANINSLVAAAGELMEGSYALYSRIQDGLLCSRAAWQAPPDMSVSSPPKGNISYDVIKKGGDRVCTMTNLEKSAYAKTDTNVSKYGVRTYVGKSVKVSGEYAGAICVVYRNDAEITYDDEDFIRLVASAISTEEERKFAREELERSEKRFRLFMDASPDMIFVKDVEHKYVMVNKALSRYFKKSELEMIGHADMEFGPEEDVTRDHVTDNEAIHQGRMVVREKKSGGWIFDVRKIPVSLEGGMVGVAGIIRDVTGERTAKEKIIEAVSRFEIVLESAPMIAIQTYDRDGKIIYWNRVSEEVYGVLSEDAIGKEPLIVFGDCQGTKDFISDMGTMWVTGKPGKPMELELYPPARGKVYVYSAVFPVFEEGKVAMIYRMDVDMTQNKESEIRLNRTVDELRKYKTITVGRENKMIDLKKEVNRLSAELGRPAPYDISFAE